MLTNIEVFGRRRAERVDLYCNVSYSLQMEVRTTPQFDAWLSNLTDSRGAAKIKSRLIQIEGGSFGDVKPCGQGVSESRIHYGPGYRIYFVQRGAVLVVVLGAGTKRTQSKDITAAQAIAKTLEDTP